LYPVCITISVDIRLIFADVIILYVVIIKSTLLEESEKLFNGLVDLLVCEVVNESVIKQSVPMPSQLPAFPSEEVRGVNDAKQN
jgi:hypothetical protein